MTYSAGVVLGEINHLFKIQNNSKFEDILWNYASLSRKLQMLPSIGGIGEPKFNVDGSLFNGPWCRPQSDGPALEASLLIEFAFNYLKLGGSIEEVSKLYDSKLPTDSVVKICLEYVSHNWSENTCDLWEEVIGDFFYTRMVQRSALIRGQAIARKMKDPLAADWYALQASQISLALEHHWSEAKGYIVSGLKNSQDIRSGLDISIILGVLHSPETPSFSPKDDRILSTFVQLVNSFSKSYDINKITHDQYNQRLGIAIGRYPEDLYNGAGKSIGNPWYLATSSLAEFLYKLAFLYTKQGIITVTYRSLPFFRDFLQLKSLALGDIKSDSKIFSQIILNCFIRGDEFLRRIKYYSPTANLSEQFDGKSGINKGAHDLSWSYASLLSAIRSRNDLRMITKK